MINLFIASIEITIIKNVCHDNLTVGQLNSVTIRSILDGLSLIESLSHEE